MKIYLKTANQKNREMIRQKKIPTKKSGEAWTPKPETSRHGSGGHRLQRSSTEPVEVVSTPKKSLRQIQEEERDRQIQADFERWWAAEEARVKAEEEAVLAAAKAASMGGSPSGQGKPPRGKGKKKHAPNSQPSGQDQGHAPAEKQVTAAIPIGQPNGKRRGPRQQK